MCVYIWQFIGSRMDYWNALGLVSTINFKDLKHILYKLSVNVFWGVDQTTATFIITVQLFLFDETLTFMETDHLPYILNWQNYFFWGGGVTTWHNLTSLCLSCSWNIINNVAPKPLLKLTNHVFVKSWEKGIHSGKKTGMHMRSYSLYVLNIVKEYI